MPPSASDVKPPGGMDSSAYLQQIQKDYVRKADNWNRERVLKLKKIRSKNIMIGLLLGATVLSVYSYSIFAIKQETFLDNFNEPETETKE